MMHYDNNNDNVDFEIDEDTTNDNDILFINNEKSSNKIQVSYKVHEEKTKFSLRFSEEIDNKNNRKKGSRGRIAEVIAARASLQHPSRPITPASLDLRTSLDSNNDNCNEITGGSNVNILRRRKQNYNENKTNVNDNNTMQRLLSDNLRLSLSNTNVEDYIFIDNCDDSNIDIKEQKNIVSLLSDIQDSLDFIDASIVRIICSKSLTSTGIFIEDRALTFSLEQAKPLYTNLEKYIRTGLAFSQIVQRDVHMMIGNIARVLMKIINEKFNDDTKYLCCRYILTLHLARIYRCTSNTSMSNSSTTQSPLPVDIANITLSTVQILYKMTNNTIDNKYKNDNKEGDEDYEILDDEDESTDDLLIQGVDLVLDILNVTWLRLQGDIRREVETEQRQQKLIKDPNINDNPNSNNSRENGFLLLLETAIYAAGIIRSYSNYDTHRICLVNLNTVTMISNGLRTTCNVCSQVEQYKENKANNRLKYVMDKLSQIHVQLIAAYRNFTLSEDGRREMLTTKAICTLCSITKQFKLYPDVILNCARVTAKLSLLEPFRSQINGKNAFIRYLVDVLINESKIKQENYNHTNSSIWYILPLLSRISFTLGNLTTSNDLNRRIVNYDGKFMQHLIFLLQNYTEKLESNYYNILNNNNENDNINSNLDESFDSVEHYKAVISNDDNLFSLQSDVTDVTIKMLRLVANLCMDTLIGNNIAKSNNIYEIILKLLNYIKLFTDNSESNSEIEELLLNVVACTTNITFYSCQSETLTKFNDEDYTSVEASKIQSKLLLLSRSLSYCLFHDNEEIVLESARALGNLTRLTITLEPLRNYRTDETLILLLNHKNSGIVMASTGALVNITSNEISRENLIKIPNLLKTLENVLRRSSLKTLELSTLLCQVIYNLLLNNGEINNKNVYFQSSNTLISALSELIECAVELEEISYQNFIKVGKDALKMLLKCK